MLAFEGLKVGYGAGKRIVPVVLDLSISLSPGECLGLVGESGSGKSQSLLAMTGLCGASACVGGTGMLDGVAWDLADASRSRQICGRQVGMLFQDAGGSLTPHFTVRRHLRELLGVHRGLRGAAADEESRRLLDLVQVPSVPDRLCQYPHELSGGLRQRVALALALAQQPRFLFADEPTSALDVTLRAGIMSLLGGLCRDARLGLLLVSHDLELVARMADRVQVMYSGRVVEEGAASVLTSRPRHPYTAALLRSRTTLQSLPFTPVHNIAGQPPVPERRPPGCAFAPRCSHADERCLHEDPALAAAPSGTRVACHHPLAWAAP